MEENQRLIGGYEIMSMDQFLAAIYDTPGSETEPQTEDLEKQAQVEFFVKVAEDSGIDVTQMNDEQVQELWDEFQQKLAEGGFPPEKKDEKKDDDDDDDEEKDAAARQEYLEKQAEVEKWAEADRMGRIMAHAYVNELRNIDGGGLGKEAKAADVVAKGKELGGKAVDAVKRYGHLMKGGKTKTLEREFGTARGIAGRTNKRSALGQLAREKATGKATALKAEQKAVRRARLGTAAAATGVAGTVGGAAALSKEKKGSAIDEMAACLAIDMAKEAGYDEQQAFDVISSIHTLGLGETEKVAFAPSFDDALELRALEYLEAAGAPVEWSEE